MQNDRDIHQPESMTRSQTIASKIAGYAVTLVIDVLVMLTIIILLWSVWDVGVGLYESLAAGNSAGLNDLMIGVLTVLIFIEVFELSVKYLSTRAVSVKDLYEVSIAVILREVWVGLFAHTMKWQMVLAVAVLLLAVGLLRAFEVRYADVKRHFGTKRAKSEDANGA